MKNQELSRVALITGGGQRLGAAMAEILHQAGLRIILHYHRSEHNAQRLAAKLNNLRPNSVELIQGDLSIITDFKAWLAPVILKFDNQLDLLVNNASLFYATPLEQATEQQWNELVNINLKAPFFLIQSLLDYLRKKNNNKNNNKNIINLVDANIFHGLKNYTVYSLTKMALLNLTESLAIELAPKIRVNAIAPGIILPPENLSETITKNLLAKIALKRWGEPLDIAKTVLFLDQNCYITGTTIRVDGGRSLYN